MATQRPFELRHRLHDHDVSDSELKRRLAPSRDVTPSTTPGTSPQVSPELRPQGDPLSFSVADVVRQHGTPVCPSALSLVGAAQLLLSSDRTAAAVFDASGEVQGILSEADVLAAYLSDAPFGLSVGEWLQCRSARVPAEAAAVHPDTPLQEAAARLLQTAALCGGTRQHLLVEGPNGKYYGILSALDLARSVAPSADLDMQDGDGEVAVARVMRPRGSLPACSLRCTVRQLLRALAASRQGAVLVADRRGVHGIVTPRDAVRAFSRRVSADEDVREHAAGLLGILQVRFERRIISADAPAWHAAAVMARHGVHHLVAVRPGGTEVVGVVSALDLARSLGGSCSPLVAPAQALRGPLLVSDAVERRSSAVCPASSSLGDACDEMMSSGRSAAVVVGEGGELLGMLTENDFLRAHAGGVLWHTLVGDWLRQGSARCPAPLLPQLTVEGRAPLLEAAGQMVSHSVSLHACRHLLVSMEDASHPAVLSSLDVARSLCEFDAERCATEAQSAVATAMKPKEIVPMVAPTSPLSEAFDLLLCSHQNCVLVVDEDNAIRGLITPRDLLLCFSEHLPGTATVGGWLHGIGAGLELRVITTDARIADAAEAMAAGNVHHLLVVEPGTNDVAGVLSSLDIVCALAEVQERGQQEVQPVPRNWHVVPELMPQHLP